jgi:hypothetical protein
MKKSILLFIVLLIPSLASADSLRCKGRLVDTGDTKADVSSICGAPEIIDSFCKPVTRSTHDTEGNETLTESCDMVDIWSYQAESGGLWKHVYFMQGQVIDIRNGERIN